ncbi:MAG: hypothetical protein AAF725_00735 [Acidobacteriota bacterium]
MLTLALLALAAIPASAESSVTWSGFGLVRGAGVDAPDSWLENGLGRFSVGGEEEASGLAKSQVTLEWRPTTTVGVFLHGVARLEPETEGGDAVGLVEAFVTFDFGLRSADRFHTQIGHFLLPTSRENIEVGWTSPYTLTFSALNSWIGEEVRGSGILSSYHLAIGERDELAIGAMGLWNNDTAGALLAWRGWAFGDRLSVIEETLPLPDIPALRDGGAFDEQNDVGTTPFTRDLDGQAGWGAFIRWQRPDVATLQYTRYDNRGDRDLHGGEYAWDTHFDLFGADLHLGNWSFAAEFMTGFTKMGIPNGFRAAADYHAGYLLASWANERFRFSLRYDDFETEEQDFSVLDDPNSGSGNGFTLAAFYESPRYPMRLGVEFLDADAERTTFGLLTGDGENGGQTLLLEVRYYFGS